MVVESGAPGQNHLQLKEGERWFAVQTLPHREAGACLQLENQGYRVFLPRIRKTRRHARKLDTVLAPFFPRYLFIILDMNRDQWRSVNGTFGVSQLEQSAVIQSRIIGFPNHLK